MEQKTPTRKRNADAARVLGGIGLFLLGMTVMTQGLRALAGYSLRRMLGRFTPVPALRGRHRRGRDGLPAVVQRRHGGGGTEERLDTVRWLHRVAYHVWRIGHHVERIDAAQPAAETGVVPTGPED